MKSSRQKMDRKEYEATLFKLQVALVRLPEWVKTTNARIVIILEGRDAAGTRKQRIIPQLW